MTQTRYGLPLIVAVAFHAALLLWIPRTDIGIVTPPEPPVVLRPFPKELVEVFRAPVEKVAHADSPKPIAQKLVPVIEEIVPMQTESAFTVPVERPRTHNIVVDKIPATFVPGDLDGVPGAPGGPGIDGMVGLDKLDCTPHAKVQTAPLYPVAMRSAGVEGTVVVEFTVDTQGNVVSATVLSATNHEFEEATIRAVMRWRFEPGRRNGRVVPFRMAVPLEFRLNDSN